MPKLSRNSQILQHLKCNEVLKTKSVCDSSKVVAVVRLLTSILCTDNTKLVAFTSCNLNALRRFICEQLENWISRGHDVVVTYWLDSSNALDRCLISNHHARQILHCSYTCGLEVHLISRCEVDLAGLPLSENYTLWAQKWHLSLCSALYVV